MGPKWNLITLAALCLPGRILEGAGEDERLSGFLSSLENLPPSLYRPDLARPEVEEALTARHPGLERFLAEHPGRFLVSWNEATGTPHRIYGDAVPLRLPGGRAPESGEEMEAAARALIARHADLFGVGEESLVLETDKDLSTFRLLRFSQVHSGLPVLGSRVEVWVAPGGRAVLLGSDVAPERLLARCAAGPRLDAAGAGACARSHASAEGMGFEPGRTRLAVVPVHRGRRMVPRLAWEVQDGRRARGGTLPGGRDPEKWVYLIAAADEASGGRAGEVLGRWDRVARGSVSGSVRGKASPGLFPDTSWNQPEFAPLPGLIVKAGAQEALTGSDGSYRLDYPGEGPVTVTASLRGPYCSVENQAGANLFFSKSAASGSVVDIDWNDSPGEIATAQVNAFRQVNRAHDFARSLDPAFTAIDRPLLTQVNIAEACNAFFIPQGEGLLAFCRSNPCVNSAYATVVLHEYAHFIVWKAFGAANPMPAYNEGVADTFAALLTDQPVIGHAFTGIQGGPAIRDLSGPALRYPGDLLQEFHRAGLILGGAFWDLREELGASLGRAAGLDLARRLYFRSLFLAPPMLSPDIALDLLVLDDDDGILRNGTPHFAEIASAFGRHGLPPPGRLAISHLPLSDSSSPGPFPLQAEVRTELDPIAPSGMTLHYSVDGGFRFQAQAMAPVALEAGAFQGEIPPQSPGTTVRYYLEARGNGGAVAVLPGGAPEEEAFAFAVGETAVVFADGFDGPENGWAHGLIPTANPENRDDWQRGAPGLGVPDPLDSIDGNLLDPRTAFSLPNCWGNDLALEGRTDKNYSDGSKNYLQSPPLDCSKRSGIHLRFRRWLTIERFDKARVLVNGVVVYQSPADRDTLDVSWRAMDHDISALADGKPQVLVRFELTSNLEGNAGGWNIDDLALVATGAPSTPRPTLTGIDPHFDFKTGGAPFTLRGSGFTTTGDTRLFFGQSLASGFTVVDAGTVTGPVPPGSPGPAVISLQNGGGAVALPGAFTYFDLPALEAVIPPRGRLAGGDAVSVHGEYYTQGSEVLIGGRSLGPLTLVGQEALVGVLPPGEDLGPVEVVIRTGYGESRFPAAFTYAERPELTGLVPRGGPLQGDIEFTLEGSFFPDAGDVDIDFGGRRAVSFRVESRTVITGRVPSAERPMTVDVTISTAGGADTLRNAFRYFDPTQPAIFIRGDTNLDRVVEITDPILTLGRLFLGEAEFLCRDAADVTDDGSVDISDAVSTLSYLFTGGPPPPLPHPDPGLDPTADPLDCAGGL